MFLRRVLAVAALAGSTAAQNGTGVDWDKPMLAGGGKRGPGAMLRFGCSQVETVFSNSTTLTDY